MINQIDISGVNYDVDTNTTKYIMKHIGKLDRFLPRHSRQSATAKITVKQVNKSHGNKYEAEVIINVPGKVITAGDQTSNALALIDIIEAKLTTQLKKYKQETMPHVGKKSLWARLKRTGE